MADDEVLTDYIPEKFIAKSAITVGIIIFAAPGLVIEPGPLSEAVALAYIVSIWIGNEDD